MFVDALVEKLKSGADDYHSNVIKLIMLFVTIFTDHSKLHQYFAMHQ